jgi:hypothetical protein
MASPFRIIGRKLVIISSVVVFAAAAIGILASAALLLMQTKSVWYPWALEAAEDAAKEQTRAETDKGD